jgi:HAD superfamily hydrolase (TIGR01509 family)
MEFNYSSQEAVNTQTHSQIKVILFDIGGTLVQKLNHDSRDPEIVSEMLHFLNLEESPENFIERLTQREKEYKQWTYRSLDELSYPERWSEYLLPEFPRDFIIENANQLQAWWGESRGKRWIPPETAQILHTLKDRGYRLGTVSHTSPKHLDNAGIRDLFDVALQAADFGKRKPHPSSFLATAQALGVRPQECAYVGNRPSRDVVGAREAGIGLVVIIESQAELPEANPCPMQADVSLHSLEEMLAQFPGANTHFVPTPTFAVDTLYDAALSTMWWSRSTDDANDFCRKGRELGFARFELNHQITPAELETFDLDRYHVGSVHDPCPAVIPNKQLELGDFQVTSLVEEKRRVGVDTLKRTIDLAYRLGSRLVVIHPGRVDGDHSMDNRLRDMYRDGLKGSEDYEILRLALIEVRLERGKPHLEALIRSLTEIVDFARDSGVFLGLENRLHHYELPSFEEMEALLKEFQQPWVGWLLDVGHIQVHDQLGLMSFKQWLEAFSSRMVGVHLHDVQDIMDHQIPGSGDVDFAWLAPYLPAQAIRTLEINNKVPYEEFLPGLKLLEKTGCITSIYSERRNESC